MRPWLAVPAALALGACAHLPPTDDGLTYEVRRDRLEDVAAWEMRGRLAIETPDEARLARFRWVQDGEALRLNVRGPFGAGSFTIEGTPPLLTVTTSRETWRLDDAERQLSEWFGWWLPAASLSTWLLGMPDPAFPAATTAFREDVLARLEQRRWSLRYGEYMLAEGLLVPRQIELRHRDLTIELTVDEWTSREAAGTS